MHSNIDITDDIDLGLSSLENSVLKIITYTNGHFQSKSEIQKLCYDIIREIPTLNKTTKSAIVKAITTLMQRSILIKPSYSILVTNIIKKEVIKATKTNNSLAKYMLYYFETNYYFNHRNTILVQLSMLCNDTKTFVKNTYCDRNFGFRDSMKEVINPLLSLGESSLLVPFLPYFTDENLSNLLSDLPYIIHINDLEDLIPLYKDQDSSSKYIVSSCAQLLLTPKKAIKINEALGLEENALFFLELLSGRLDMALDMGNTLLESVQREAGHKRKELPGIFGLLYAITLLSNNEAKNLSLAATFLRSGIKQLKEYNDQKSPYKSFAKIILMVINHRLGKERIDAASIFDQYDLEQHLQFLFATVAWHGHSAPGQPWGKFTNEREEYELRACGFFSEFKTQKENDARFATLQKKLKISPLVSLCRPAEDWENILSILANSLPKEDKKVTKQTAKRLIWLVDPLDRESLTCLEQTSTRNGWNKGKDRKLHRLITAIPEFASDKDKDIIACIQKHPYYGNHAYIKSWDKLMKALASHNEVYTLSEPHLPISIRIEEAQIQINTSDDGVKISVTPKSKAELITQEAPTSYIYTNWSTQATQVYNTLKDSGISEIKIPAKAVKKAKPILEKISASLPVAGDYAKNNASKQVSDNIPVLQLTPVDDQLHVQLLIEVMKGEDTRVVPGIGSTELLITNAKKKQVNITRHKEQEKKLMISLANKVDWLQDMKSSSAQLFLDNDEEILDFLADVKEHAEEVKVIWPRGERLKVSKVLTQKDVNVKISERNNWFEVDGQIKIDEKLRLNILDLLRMSDGGTSKYIQLDDKTYLKICRDLRKRLEHLNVVAQTNDKQLLVHPLGSNGIESFVEGMEEVSTDAFWQQHMQKLDQVKTYTPSLANNLQAELRPYQEEGILWLDRLHHWGVGACLADDMGLGKTIQAISIMLKYASDGPSLVLAPSSVCNNWIKEIVRFAPTLNCVQFRTQKREDELDKLTNNDVLIVSYGIIQSNPELLNSMDWNIVVLDEAHAIKNANTVRSKSVMKLKAKFRIITTGTPIQNHLGELWNLFQFINPGMLSTHEHFMKQFGLNNDTKKLNVGRKSLNRYIAPFILRRNKNEVLDDLPEKTEITLKVTLSDEERALYEALRERALEQINSKNNQGGSRHIQILAEITKLRQMSCHPRLVQPQSTISSSKLEALENLVTDLIDAKHKALVFSQFTQHLGLIRQMLDDRGISYQYLDGSTPIKKRQQAIDNFQAGMSDLFLISLKAGGVGLNLTAADYVIHMDPWWNPAIEDQASDRAHRLGQKRPVTIYRIIAEQTIEEKIVKMHHEKRDLADKLLADTDQSAKISSEELFDLIAQKE